MSDFQEIFKKCLESKKNNNEEDFNKNLELLYENNDVQEMVKSFQASYGISEIIIKEYIKERLNEHNYKKVPKFSPTFKREIYEKVKIDEEIYALENQDRQNFINAFTAKYKNKNINDSITIESMRKGISIINGIFDLVDEERIDVKSFISSLSEKAGFEKKESQKVKHILLELCKIYPTKFMRLLIKRLTTYSEYTKLIEYIMFNQKLSIPNLILDFNKVRDYLFVLLNKNVKDKKSFIEQCSLSSTSSYEKEVFRISSLFKIEKGRFIKAKNELKNYKPNEFSKIYDIHNVPNLVVNFMILDVLQKIESEIESKNIKIKLIMKELSPLIENTIGISAAMTEKRGNNSKNKKVTADPIKTFRKYTLLPRLKEMAEYGFITINKDIYSLKVKFLNDKQKNALKYVVPFFCGIYPFTSIGHFWVNRLDSDEKFITEPYNVSNILDDCIFYDLLEAIKNNKSINLIFKNKSNINKFKPIKIILDKDNLLKVTDNKNEYYLSQIKDVNYNGKPQNLIFSEIYSFYYKVFEDSINLLKKDKKSSHNISKDKSLKIFEKYFPEKYKSYEKIFHKNTFEKLLPRLSKLKNCTVPLTTLELRWLKTIMQDPRFDLFISEEEKQDLEKLVCDIDAFDLSTFKIYDYKEKTYKNLINKDLIKIVQKINKNEFQNKLNKINSAIYFIKDNKFEFK